MKCGAGRDECGYSNHLLSRCLPRAGCREPEKGKNRELGLNSGVVCGDRWAQREMEGIGPKFRSSDIGPLYLAFPWYWRSNLGRCSGIYAPSQGVIDRHPSEVAGMLGSQIQATPLYL